MVSKESRLVIGIENNLNSCYLNSVLQILFTIKPLNMFILKCQSFYKPPKNFKELLIISYKNLLEHIYEIDEFYVDNENMLESEQFKNILEKGLNFPLSYEQHDVHEILINILNIFHEGMKQNTIEKKSYKSENKLASIAFHKWEEYNKIEKYSIINKLMKGQMRNSITCQQCFLENNIFDSFSDITIQINQNTTNLEQCIQTFCETETIEFFCERCKTKRKAWKKIILCRPPQYLIININRFQQTKEEQGITITKNNKSITFPLENLTIESNNGDEPTINKYNLKGCIFHHGKQIDSGHYTSLININDSLIHINDEEIEIVNDQYQGDVYLLLYQLVI